MDPDTLAKLKDFTLRAEKQRKRFFARQPRPAAGLVAQVVAKRGYAASGSNERLSEAWTEAAGPVMAKHSEVAGLRRGVLEIMVRSSAMLQEVQFHKLRMLKAIQTTLPDARITRLKFRVGRLRGAS